ncbi:MAG: hypothetical protein IPL61_17075 [Myxococcales bacterium]|nr:hypothetical protein [Myxococcales bacterium]
MATRDEQDFQPDVTTATPTPTPPPDCGPGNPIKPMAQLATGAATMYKNTTAKDASGTNVSTDVPRSEFEANLKSQGFTSTTSADGKAVTWGQVSIVV